MNLGQPRGRCLLPIPAHPFHALKRLVSPPNSLGTLLPAPGSQGADGRAGDLCAIWGQNIQTAPLIFHHSICQRCRLRRRIKISARLPSLAAGTSLLPLPCSSRAPRAQGRDSERPRRGGRRHQGSTPCACNPDTRSSSLPPANPTGKPLAARRIPAPSVLISCKAAVPEASGFKRGHPSA